MDPEETDHIKRAITTQNAMVSQHDAALRQVMDNLQQLATSVAQLGGRMDAVANQLSTLSTAPDPPPPAMPAQQPAPVPIQIPREPYIPIPARYSGNLGTCAQFLHQCSLVFSQQPATYATDQSKIAFIMSLLSDQASAWALAVSTHSPTICAEYSAFTQEMKNVFDHPVKGREATSQMLRLRQGSQSVSQYALEFRILAAESGWNDPALRDIFHKGLAEELKDELATRDEPASLEGLITLAIKLDNRLRERRRERSLGQRPRPLTSTPANPPRTFSSSSTPPSGSPGLNSSPPNPPPANEPMQLGRAKLTPEERQRRFSNRLCFYCGQKGHYLAQCSDASKGQAHQQEGGRW